MKSPNHENIWPDKNSRINNIKTYSVIGALRWSGLRSIIKLVSAIIVPIILARLLSPNEFGLMAMAAVFTNISLLITDLGTGDALIQNQKADKILESSIFWLNLAIAGCAAIVLTIASSFIAEFYDQPIVENIVQLLVVVLLLQSVTLVQVSLLKKRRDFKAIATAELSSQIAGAIVAISLAINNFGVWSLIFYAIAKAFFYTLVVWFLSDWKPWFHFSIAKVRTIFSFSINLTTVKFLNYVERNSDKLIIGYTQGASNLGMYARAYTSFNQLIKLVNGFYNPVFYSVVAEKQNDKEYLKRILLKSYQSLLFVFLPVSVVLMLFSSGLVLIVFGTQWLEMAPILSILGAVLIVKPIHKLNVEVFKSVNKVETLRRVWVGFTPVFVTGFIIGNNLNGSVGVAQAYLITSIMIAVVTTGLVMDYLGISMNEIRTTFLNLIIRGCIIFYMAITLVSFSFFEGLNWLPEIIFISQVAFVGLIYLSLQLVFPVKAQHEIMKLVRRRV